MRLHSFLRPTLLALALTPTILFSAVSAPRVAIVENTDSFTRVAGLGEFLRSEQIPFKDLSGDFKRGQVPALEQTDLLIVGSFVTSNPQMRAAYDAAGKTLRRFVADGGVVAVLAQADQDYEIEKWMMPPREVVRADPDAGTVYKLQPEHPLLKQVVALTSADLSGWRVPTNWAAANTAWEAFTKWNEAAVVLGTSDSRSPAAAALLEMGWGSGRAVFYAMAPDKAVAAGNDVSRRAGAGLLRNLLAYAELVRARQAPAVQITLPPGYKYPIHGTIYVDANGNGRGDPQERGRAGVAVSDGADVVLTDGAGAYRLPNAGANAIFVFVHQPGDVKQSGQEFFRRLPDEGASGERFDIGLQPAPDGAGAHEGARFVQLTDSHVRNVSDRDYMQQATAEIYAMQPPPDFVVATGDLVDWGVDEHFTNYVAGMNSPPVPYFNVFGNHEIVYGPIERYHHYIGPDYYSFERGGILFLALNCVTRTARQEAWLEQTLKLLAKGRPVVVLQHFPPGLAELERFAQMGVKSVFSGHWHSEKEMEHASVQSINSPTFIMGGIDASPAGFKVVRLAGNGSAETEWRYGFQNRRLTIVSPQEGAPVSASYFPVIVNAYDTSRDVVLAKWRLGPEGAPLGSGTLQRESAMTWAGAHNGPATPRGSHAFHVEVRDERGATWSASRKIETRADAPAQPAIGGAWPMFMGNAAHSGFTSQALAMPLRLAWSVDTGGDPDFASPILADGRIYLALKKRTGGRQNGVAAFDPATGKRLWLFETAMAVNHTPAYADGIICVAEMGGRIYGLDAATGRERWHHDLIDQRGRYNYCAPAADDGWFYAGVMRRMARLRPADGHVDWERQIGGADNDWISSYGSPAVADGGIAMTGQFSRGDSMVFANATNGAKLWGHAADGGMLGSAAISGERVLFCSQRSILYCARREDGTVLWSRGLGANGAGANWSATTPAIRAAGEGQGMVVAGSGDGRMCGLDLADGRILWTHVSQSTVFKVSPYRRDDRPLLSSPTIAADKVLFGSADGHLYCIEAETGRDLWSFAIGASVMSTPLVTGNAVYVAAYDGRLYAFTGESP